MNQNQNETIEIFKQICLNEGMNMILIETFEIMFNSLISQLNNKNNNNESDDNTSNEENQNDHLFQLNECLKRSRELKESKLQEVNQSFDEIIDIDEMNEIIENSIEMKNENEMKELKLKEEKEQNETNEINQNEEENEKSLEDTINEIKFFLDNPSESYLHLSSMLPIPKNQQIDQIEQYNQIQEFTQMMNEFEDKNDYKEMKEEKEIKESEEEYYDENNQIMMKMQRNDTDLISVVDLSVPSVQLQNEISIQNNQQDVLYTDDENEINSNEQSLLSVPSVYSLPNYPSLNQNQQQIQNDVDDYSEMMQQSQLPVYQDITSSMINEMEPKYEDTIEISNETIQHQSNQNNQNEIQTQQQNQNKPHQMTQYQISPMIYRIQKEVEEVKSVLLDTVSSSDEMNQRRIQEEQLKDWSHIEKMKPIYDSKTHPHDNLTFNNIIMNKPNLYFIMYDEFGNVYGCYMKQPLTKINNTWTDASWNYDKDHFIFTLQIGSIDCPKRWFARNEQTGMKLSLNSSMFFTIGNNQSTQMIVSKPYSKTSSIVHIPQYYNGSFKGSHFGIDMRHFYVRRIIVIQMEDDGMFYFKGKKLQTQDLQEDEWEIPDLPQTLKFQKNTVFEGILTNEEVSQLVEWSGMYHPILLYDSKNKDIDMEEFLLKLTFKPNIYLIIMDDTKNVFGCFMGKKISIISEMNKQPQWNYDENQFVFRLRNKGESQFERWFAIHRKDVGFVVFDKGTFICTIGQSKQGQIQIHQKGFKSGCISLENVYQGIKNNSLVSSYAGSKNQQPFILQRILIIKMES